VVEKWLASRSMHGTLKPSPEYPPPIRRPAGDYHADDYYRLENDLSIRF